MYSRPQNLKVRSWSFGLQIPQLAAKCSGRGGLVSEKNFGPEQPPASNISEMGTGWRPTPETEDDNRETQHPAVSPLADHHGADEQDGLGPEPAPLDATPLRRESHGGRIALTVLLAAVILPATYLFIEYLGAGTQQLRQAAGCLVVDLLAVFALVRLWRSGSAINRGVQGSRDKHPVVGNSRQTEHSVIIAPPDLHGFRRSPAPSPEHLDSLDMRAAPSQDPPLEPNRFGWRPTESSSEPDPGGLGGSQVRSKEMPLAAKRKLGIAMCALIAIGTGLLAAALLRSAVLRMPNAMTFVIFTVAAVVTFAVLSSLRARSYNTYVGEVHGSRLYRWDESGNSLPPLLYGRVSGRWSGLSVSDGDRVEIYGYWDETNEIFKVQRYHNLTTEITSTADS